jgi:RNA polymerase sigma-70 factor (ECF subfamily)
MDHAAWNRFVELYTPFLYAWSRRIGLPHEDAADLVQEILVVLLDKLPGFEYDQAGSFRGWLKTITNNRAKNFFRTQAIRPAVGFDSAVQQAAMSPETDLFERAEYQSFLTKRLLELVKPEFRQDVWQAFWLQIFEQQPASKVALELGLSLNSVYIAKSRVLRRLREESQGLLE